MYPHLRHVLVLEAANLPRSAEAVLRAPSTPTAHLVARLQAVARKICLAPGSSAVQVEPSIANEYAQGTIPWPSS
jgi:hypothetical protein